MRGLLKVGEGMSEARLLPGQGAPGIAGAMTRSEAQAERTRLLGDAEFRKRFLSGDVEANKLMGNIDRIIVGRDVLR